MPIRFSSMLVLPALLGAGVIAYLVSDRVPETGPTSVAPAVVAPLSEADNAAGAPMGALPPNHPPIGAMSQHGGAPPSGGDVPNAASEEPAAIAWKAPASWSTVPNASTMRLATYRVGRDAELSVVRAGGSVDANVDRWQEQFQQGARIDRKDRTVHGLKVTVVRIDGTFEGGGGMPGSAEPHASWAMLAAIVEPATAGSPYFFKLLGPADQVDAARTSFDGLLEGITPNAAQ